ncbi:MAG: enoyl-CoA hydratase/isomerase family protein [Candidatus Heimdallarchaeota archaeon]|nr:enoyl-CoA hydratase/isomerase family protein [Candidatus Heimdallarchaeota archaeon]
MTSNVRYNTKSKVGEIILDGPKNNPLDLETLLDLIIEFKNSANNQDRCVLFKAVGPNFTVGADLKYIHKLVQEQDTVKFREFSTAFQDLSRAMLNHPGIIIAGLHGWVVGGGFEISLSADIRYASNDTRIMFPELSIGTMFSNASTKLLGQIIGLGRAKELMFLGEEISAERGFEIGLLNKVCDEETLDDEMNITAGKIISGIEPYALKLAKTLIHKNQNLSIEEVLNNELEILSELSTHAAFIEKINNFVKK